MGGGWRVAGGLKECFQLTGSCFLSEGVLFAVLLGRGEYVASVLCCVLLSGGVLLGQDAASLCISCSKVFISCYE